MTAGSSRSSMSTSNFWRTMPSSIRERAPSLRPRPRMAPFSGRVSASSTWIPRSRAQRAAASIIFGARPPPRHSGSTDRATSAQAPMRAISIMPRTGSPGSGEQAIRPAG